MGSIHLVSLCILPYMRCLCAPLTRLYRSPLFTHNAVINFPTLIHSYLRSHPPRLRRIPTMKELVPPMPMRTPT